MRSLLLSVCLLLATSALAAEPSPIYQELQGVSVLVKVGNDAGTGVLVTKQVGDVTRTYVWTAGHVVAGLLQPDGTFQPASIVRESRKSGKFTGKSETEAKVIAYSDPEAGEDLALLEVLEDNFRPLTVTTRFDLTGVIQPAGTNLIHVGCTLGFYGSVSLGVISQTDRDPRQTGKWYDQTSCLCYPGSSGGGVFLTDGTYIGMVVKAAGPGLNFVIPMRRIIPWAKTMGVLWALDPAQPVPSAAARALLPLTDGTEKRGE